MAPWWSPRSNACWPSSSSSAMRRSPSASPLPKPKSSPKSSRSGSSAKPPESKADPESRESNGCAAGCAARRCRGRRCGRRDRGCGRRTGGERRMARVELARLGDQPLRLGVLAPVPRILRGAQEALDVGRRLVTLAGRGGEARGFGVGDHRLAVGRGELQGLVEAPLFDQLAEAPAQIPARRGGLGVRGLGGGGRQLGQVVEVGQVLQVRQVVERGERPIEVQLGALPRAIAAALPRPRESSAASARRVGRASRRADRRRRPRPRSSPGGSGVPSRGGTAGRAGG